MYNRVSDRGQLRRTRHTSYLGCVLANDMTSSTFNKPAPPRFRGIHPDLPVRMYSRRLPHWRQDGVTYAVTFRQADSIPQKHLQALKRWRAVWESRHPEPRSEADWKQYAQEISNKSDRWLDEGFGSCVFRDPRLANIMSDSLVHFQDQRYFTSCFVVMPNHVHAVIKPFDGYDLESLLQRMKIYVAIRVNKSLERSCELWEEESYDRMIRNEEHLWNIVQYIGRNPRKANLPVGQWVRWIHPDWKAAGWDFIDA
jgi:putative transposase